MDMKTVYTFVILIIVVLGGIVALRYYSETPGANDPELAQKFSFAQCLEDSGAVFYGASWCNHCLNQKRKFGRAEKELPYVECSTPDRSGRTQICIDEGIETYPTWRFSDGSELTGVQELVALAEKTGCDLSDQETDQQETDPTNEDEIVEIPPPPEEPQYKVTDGQSPEPTETTPIRPGN